MKKKKDLYERFIRGCEKKGMSFVQAKVLWDKMEYFSGYGFSKNHAVPYSIISYQCAWLQTYYRDEWIAAFLDHEPEKRKEAAINIARSFGYEVKVLTSTRQVFVGKFRDGKLISPLTTIKGLGEAAIEELVHKRPFSTVEDLLFDKGCGRTESQQEVAGCPLSSRCDDILDGR